MINSDSPHFALPFLSFHAELALLSLESNISVLLCGSDFGHILSPFTAVGLSIKVQKTLEELCH